MKKIDWPAIIEEEYDNIIDALRALYTESCSFERNDDACQILKIDLDGTVIHHTYRIDSTSAAVWTGDAIELARLPWFNPLDEADEADVINTYLKKEDLDAFNQFLAGDKPTIANLRQWNTAAADRVLKLFMDDYVDGRAEAWAEEEMKKILKRAEEYKKTMEEEEK